MDYTLTGADAKSFASLEELRKVSGLEQNGVYVDYDIFMDLNAPDFQDPHGVYHAEDLNFRLNPNGKAVDAGQIIPNVNDGFKGDAPDLGALEVGMEMPVYGPRNLQNHPFYR